MSDPVALVCTRGSSSNEAPAPRWRRRGLTPHTVRTRAAQPSRPVRSRSITTRRTLLLALLGCAGWLSFTTVLNHSGDADFSRRIGAGCEELEPCLSLEAEAEQRRDACSLFCDAESAGLAAARQMRFRAEERRAVRDHYRERDRAESLERQRERDERREAWQRDQAARAAEASREQRHRLELERLRQEHIDRRIADERQRRVSYLSALGPEGRALRLERCLKRGRERCDVLALDLLDAADDDAERRKLAETNEGVVRPPPKPARSDEPGEPVTPELMDSPLPSAVVAPAHDARAIPSS